MPLSSGTRVGSREIAAQPGAGGTLPVHSESRRRIVRPGFCLPFDVLAGGFPAMLLMRRSGFTSKY